MKTGKLGLEINTDLVRTILTKFIKTELERAGFSHGVIGVSGGIDSALSCYLAAEALGPENVLAIRMPYATSSAASLEHAQLVIEATGVQQELREASGLALGETRQHAAIPAPDLLFEIPREGLAVHRPRTASWPE